MYMSTEQIFSLSSLRIFLNVKGRKPKNTQQNPYSTEKNKQKLNTYVMQCFEGHFVSLLYYDTTASLYNSQMFTILMRGCYVTDHS